MSTSFSPAASMKHVVRLALAAAAVLMLMAVMSNTAMASSHSHAKSSDGLIDVDISGNRVLTGNELNVLTLEIDKIELTCVGGVGVQSQACADKVGNGLFVLVPVKILNITLDDLTVNIGNFVFHKAWH